MKIETTNKKDRLEFFKSLYESAKNSYSDILLGFERSMSQYRGSHEIDGSRESATTVRNITYEIIESQVSSDIPHPSSFTDIERVSLSSLTVISTRAAPAFTEFSEISRMLRDNSFINLP